MRNGKLVYCFEQFFVGFGAGLEAKLTQYSRQQAAWFEVHAVDERNLSVAGQLQGQLAHRRGFARTFRSVQKTDAIGIAQRHLQECQPIVMRQVLDRDQRSGVLRKRLIAQ